MAKLGEQDIPAGRQQARDVGGRLAVAESTISVVAWWSWVAEVAKPLAVGSRRVMFGVLSIPPERADFAFRIAGVADGTTVGDHLDVEPVRALGVGVLIPSSVAWARSGLVLDQRRQTAGDAVDVRIDRHRRRPRARERTQAAVFGPTRSMEVRAASLRRAAGR